LRRATFEYILDVISKDLIRKTKGYETIPPRKQFLIALWKMATMDSYRYDYYAFIVYMFLPTLDSAYYVYL